MADRFICLLGSKHMTENLELIALLGNEGSGESPHMHRLSRAFAACIYKMDEDEDSDQNLDL